MLAQPHARSWAIRLQRYFSAGSCARQPFSTNAHTSTAADQKPSPPPYDILFCGSDEFSCASLTALHRRRDLWKNLTVLHPPDTLQKWGARRMSVAPLQVLAKELNLDHVEVPRSGLDEWMPPIASSPHSLLVTVSFGHMIPDALLDHFSQNLNLHPSMLPKLRGAAPLQWAIARRMSETGITVQSLSRGAFDQGRILAQMPYEIRDGHTYESLLKGVSYEGAKLLVDSIANLPERVTEARQQSGKPTFAPKLKRDFMRIRWNEWTASDIDARHRGMGYLYPVHSDLFNYSNPTARQICTHFVNVNVFEKNQSPLAEKTKAFLADPDVKPGMARYAREAGGVLIRCVGPSVLLARTLQVASKKRQKAGEWIVGYGDRGDKNKILQFGNHEDQAASSPDREMKQI